jgi:hypothetical protein
MAHITPPFVVVLGQARGRTNVVGAESGEGPSGAGSQMRD